MALADIRQFLFYFKYLWSPSDFTNMQTWLQSEYRGIAEGAFGTSVLTGIQPSVVSGLTVELSDGIAIDPDGRIVVFASEQATFASPIGNPAKSLIVLRPKLTESDFIPEPVNPSNSVPLHEKFEYDLIVIDGTPAGSPVYPATVAGDIIVLGVTLTAGQVTLTYANIDRSIIDLPRKRVHRFKTVTDAIVEGLVTDETVDADATSNAIIYVLPDSQECPGEDFTVTKIDSSSNEVAVSGANARLIAGETSQTMDSQWQSMTFRSIGPAWRVL